MPASPHPPREIAIGDVHGCHQALTKLLETLRPAANDTLVFLGDYVDRGPASCEVVETIIELSRRCSVIALRGNHEIMLVDARDDYSTFMEWLKHGGGDTLQSYERCGYPRGIEGLPPHHWKFVSEQTLPYWETEQTIYVHAALDPALPLDEQPGYLLYWERFANPMVHKSGKPVICGHTSQVSGLPAIFERGLCLDSWVYGRGWLTAYDLRAQQFFQANQRGEQREFTLRWLAGKGNTLAF